MSQTKIAEKIKTHFIYNRALYDNVKKCGRAGHATDDNII